MDRYDINFEQVEIEVGGVKYLIRELAGDGSESYMELIASKSSIVTEVDPDNDELTLQRVKMESFSGLQIPLILLCLRDESGEKVPDAVVKAWPQRVIKEVHAKCQEVCKMGKAAALAEKAAAKKFGKLP